MTYVLLLEIAWKSVVISGLTLLLLALLKNRSAAERSLVAHAGLVATSLLPPAVLLLPSWEVEAPATFPELMVTAPAAPIPLVDVPAAELLFDTSALSLLIYAVPAGLLLLVTLIAVLRLFALRARASVLVEQSWLSALAHAQRRMNFKYGTALLVSNELTSPVSWGIVRSTILINKEAVACHEEAEAIIAHELAHLARLDWAKLLIARAATAIFWFNPFVWMLARQCYQLREEAADDAVLRSDVPSADYAALLVGAARHGNKAMLLAANGVAPGRNSLKRRVTRVLDIKLRRTPPRIAWTAACSAGAVLISASVSALSPVSPPPAAMVGDPAFMSPQTVVAVASAQAAVVLVEPTTTNVEGVAKESVAINAAPPDEKPVQLAQDLSRDMSLAMRVHGLTPEYARELAESNPHFAYLTQEQLIGLRAHNVSADEVRKIAEFGYPNISYEDVVAMAAHKVSPSFIQEMAALGFRGLTRDQLTEMRVHEVSPADIRELKVAGYADLNIDELVSMRRQGVGVKGRGGSLPMRHLPPHPVQ